MKLVKVFWVLGLACAMAGAATLAMIWRRQIGAAELLWAVAWACEGAALAILSLSARFIFFDSKPRTRQGGK